MRAAILTVSILLSLAWLGPSMARETLMVPDVTATGVYAFDSDTGEVILEQNSNERLAIGSVTKVMTALVVIDHLDLDDDVVIVGEDMVPEGYSSMMLQPGDTLTVEQLLTGAMVVSGGDAATALARTVGAQVSGSDDPSEAVAAFVDAMNERAAALGLNDTQFANPDGMDSDDAWSSAHDVAVMFAALMENPDLAEFVGMASYSFASVGPEATPYEGYTTNQLLGQSGVVGGKTGSETNAGGCVVLAREGGGSTEIVAILGADLEYDETWTPLVDARWDDASAVLNLIDAEWQPGQSADEASTADDETAEQGGDDRTGRQGTETTDDDAPADAPIGFAGQETEAASTDGNDELPSGDEAGIVSTAVEGVPVEAEATSVVSDSDSGNSATKPIVVVTVTGGVLALAAAYTWLRGSRSSVG